MRFKSPSTTNQNLFPFRRDNRRPDGTWDAPDATDDKVKGTSVDPYDPVWPRWTKAPPIGGEGEFVSNQPFFDIDESRRKRRSIRPARHSWTRTSTAIQRAANAFAMFLPAICGGDDFSCSAKIRPKQTWCQEAKHPMPT